MEDKILIIKFDNVSASQANTYATELRDFLRNANPKLKVSRQNSATNTQDIGSDLVMWLGAGGGALTIINALQNWLTKAPDTELIIIIKKNGDEKRLETKGLRGKQIIEVVKREFEK